MMIFQPVLNHQYIGACRYTGYQNRTIRLKLECGHEQFRKLSQGVPNKARCRECERDRPMMHGGQNAQAG